MTIPYAADGRDVALVTNSLIEEAISNFPSEDAWIVVFEFPVEKSISYSTWPSFGKLTRVRRSNITQSSI